jgi:hypothetical protein
MSWRYRLEDAWNYIRRDIPNFFANIWRFRRELRRHQWWDYNFTLEIMLKSFQIMEKGLSEKGIEERVSLNKKLEKIRRTIHILECINDSRWIEMAEAELGELPPSTIFFEPIPDKPGLTQMKDRDSDEVSAIRSKIYERAREIEESYWVELWDILKGQDYSMFDKSKDWQDQFDGSGMRGWWD